MERLREGRIEGRKDRNWIQSLDSECTELACVSKAIAN